MNGKTETKSEIRARIDELERLKSIGEIPDRITELKEKLNAADEDMSVTILQSHRALCAAKKMGEKQAYGHDPAMYYSLGVCGEAGEMANKIVKAMRYGPDARARFIPAIESELPDVIIYAFILAHTHDINLPRLVNAKAGVVIQRALDGYYGGPLPPAYQEHILPSLHEEDSRRDRTIRSVEAHYGSLADDPADWSESTSGGQKVSDVFPPNGETCGVCESPQYDTPGGPICDNGHGGAPPKGTEER